MAAAVHGSPRVADGGTTRTGEQWLGYKFAYVALAILAAIAILFASSRWGIGVLADSTVYVGSARTLMTVGALQDLDAQGNVMPMVHSAPLYPASIAWLAMAMHTDALDSARLISAICFGLNVALMGWLALRWLRSPLLGLVAAMLTLVATPMFDVHATVLSEPLFLVFALSAMGLLAGHVESGSRKFLIAAALFSALAAMTRYAGVALLGGETLVVFFLPRTRPFARKFWDTVLFGLIAGSPLLGWLLRNRSVSGKATTARVSLDHWGGTNPVWGGLETYSSWLLPGAVPSVIRVAIMFLLVGSLLAYLLFARRKATATSNQASSDGSSLAFVLLFFVISHIAVTSIAIAFLYNGIPMDDRNLLPTLCPAILLALWSLKRGLNGGGFVMRHVLAWAPAMVLLLSFAATNTPRTIAHVRKAAAEGRGYASRQWQDSEVVRLLRRVPVEIPVYSSLPSAVRFLTGAPARLLPKDYDFREARKNLNYQAEWEKIQREAHQPGVALAFIGGLEDQGIEYQNRMQSSLGLTSVAQDKIGTLLLSPALSKQPEFAASR